MLRKLTSLFSVTALMLATGASLPTKADDHEVVIGFAVALSGWMSDYDVPPLRGSELAVEEMAVTQAFSDRLARKKSLGEEVDRDTVNPIHSIIPT